MDPGPEPETASGQRQSLTRSGAIEVRRKDVVEVEQWAELRRLHFADGVPIRELRRRTGLGRNTIRRALRREEPPRYERRTGASKLDPFKEEIKHLLREEPRLRLQGYMRTNFEPGRRFANHLDCQDQLDRWFDDRANLRIHRTLRRAPVEMLTEERAAMRALPKRAPDVERRFVMRVGPDPYLRLDTNDYSLDPALVGRRVEVRVDQRSLSATALDTGELAARHERCFAKHRTITAPAHAAVLHKGEPSNPGRAGALVETRPLSRYDALIPA
jgi:hypothetical protein